MADLFIHRSSDKKSYPVYSSYELRSWSVPQLRELAERKKFDQPPVDTYHFIPFEEIEQEKKKEEEKEKEQGGEGEGKKEKVRRKVYDRIEARKARVTTPGKRQRYRKNWPKLPEDSTSLSLIHHASYVAVFEIYEEDRNQFGGLAPVKDDRPNQSPFVDSQAMADAQKNANVALLVNYQGTIATLIDLLMLYCDFENPATKELVVHPDLVLLESLLNIFVKITESGTISSHSFFPISFLFSFVFFVSLFFLVLFFSFFSFVFFPFP